MAKYYLALLMVRLLLPAGLLLSIALRPFGLSVIYLLLYLIAPWPQVPDSRTIRGCRGKCLLINVLVSICMLLVHVAWHSTLAAYGSYGSLLEDYPLVRVIGYNLGLVSYESIDPFMAVHYVAPELVMSGTSLIVYLTVRKLLMSPIPTEPRAKVTKHQQYPLLTSAGKYISLFLIMFSGIMRPSVTSGIYYLVFMGAATAWSLGKPLEKGFAVVARCVMAIMAAHVAGLLAYQSSWLCDMYPPTEDFARYFGLTKLVELNATDSSSFEYEAAADDSWATLASPLVILVTYYVLALEARELFKPKPRAKSALTGIEAGKLNGSLVRGLSFHRGSRRLPKDKWMNATKKVRVAYAYINSKALREESSETDPLLRNISPSKRWSSVRGGPARPLHQDSTGSVVVPDEESTLEMEEPSLLDDIKVAVVDFFQVIIRSSYIATTITMMAWSIMFHSWVAFVFLMWANVVWLCPKQRSFMLRTSPVLVLYAMLLLVADYIYGMDLLETELPSNVTAVNLRQIGFGRPTGEPFIPLLIKSLFTCMFWVTLRQRIQEMREKRQSAVVTDMAAPLQLTVSAAASVIEARKEEENRSRLLTALGDWLKAMCARYWIYVVVIMLFVIGITGERMTIFRIVYMFLFLMFILVFQISWYIWRRFMYLFWIIVIIYSMLNLILIYIYQFDKLSKFIEEYLFINERLQHDLGLEPYKPADLFVKLLTPTLFLIITIMQVHYFHRDFMKWTDPRTRSNSMARGAGSSRPSQTAASTIRDDLPPLPDEDERPPSPRSITEADQSLTSVAEKSRKSFQRKASRTRSYAPTLTERPSTAFRDWFAVLVRRARLLLAEWTDKVFVYLELHMIKIVLIALMLLCVLNVCEVHVPIMIMAAFACVLTTRKQRHVVLLASITVSAILMAVMVYQIDYIKHAEFDVNCTSTTDNGTVNYTVYNNADWVGFHKTTSEKAKVSLVYILKGYIAMIALFTFNSLVTYRQQTIRAQVLLPKHKDKLMFPDITRTDADKDLIHCIKYLVNYGFYKFGVEITLICLIGVIGSRMDLYAVLYSVWLLTLVSMRRTQQAKIWGAFTIFVTILVPIQYIIAVGLPPQFCVQYPWSGLSKRMKHVRTWLFLPYADEPPHATKLIFDFFLLMFASRQLRVFRVERARGNTYPGGSNDEDMGKDWETPNFVNPVPDFLGTVTSWLDVVKRMIFLGMLWVTLAIMFLTGTNRVNLFSMGYLIGSFIFLWQGTDFYLRPRQTILQWWSWLLKYNVSVVVIKALLQVPGCIFSSVMQEHACWLVQLLGIGCVDKFVGGNIGKFWKMEYEKTASCSVPAEDIGLAWDGVCFAFLILQRRLFYSYYFYRVIDESKATTVLASRGAELIEELRQKQMLAQDDQECKILEKIKVKMERIKENQKKIQGALSKDPHTHQREEDDDDDEDDETHHGDRIPLVRDDSDVSGRGYHTPQSPASPRGFHTPVTEESEPPSRADTPNLPINPPPLPLPTLSSSIHGPPSPSSALMTVSLDAYLEPRRISFESPPNSELMPRRSRAQSPEESYPVFSPPPIRRRNTIASPSLLQRTSIISVSSRAEPHSHHTCRPSTKPPSSHQRAVRSGDYYMFDEFDDTDVQLKDEESSSDEDAPKEMGFGKLLATVIKTDLKRAVSLRRASAPAVRAERRLSLGSAPLTYEHDVRRRRSDIAQEGDINVILPEKEKDDALSELAEITEPPEKETLFEKIKRLLQTAWAVVSSLLVSLTRHLMKYSRDYRYVSRTLSVEKKLLKETEGFGMGKREGSHMIWEPLPEALLHRPHRKLSQISVPEIRILAPSMERGLDRSPPPARRLPPAPPSRPSTPSTPSLPSEDGTSEHESMFSLQTTGSKDVSALEEQDDSMFRQDRSPFVHLAYALWFAVIAHTDIVCYIMVFINQIQSATILSIPLPLMVFLWGTLSIPRPTKTFWVTLIAYTEVIVLMKTMFQFEILPWNQKAFPTNMPFTAPRIIGIERKPKYALYDLLLLLIIFLHRFMLKSLGLWKESAPEVELHDDAEYQLTKEDAARAAAGGGPDVARKYLQLHERTGPRHPLVDRLSRVHQYFLEAAELLGVSKSDPRVAGLVAQWMRQRMPPSPLREQSIIDEEAENASVDKELSTIPGDHPDEAGPSKPINDDHYSVNDDQEPIIAITTTIEDNYNHYPAIIVSSIKRYLRPVNRFFKRMLAPGARVTADIYAYMFLCDFFNFMVVIFGFAAFGTHQGDGGVKAYLEENKVPIPFLIMLILQFGLIIIDRALYLRKFMLGKIIFQYALIIGVHVWMFFVLPFITERTFNDRLPPPMWYMIKCVYLLLSAYQIRCGYPRRIIGNFLCKSYRFLNMACFRGFMAIPFVFELRTLMDWIWTDTSMTVMDWLKMEDIFASVFLLKCSRCMEDEFPQPRGTKKRNATKYMVGGGALAFVIAIIWFPLVLFALGNTVGQPNPPTDVTVKIRIGPFLPVYQMSAQSHNIDLYTQQDYNQLSNKYARDRNAQTFLSNYIYNDVAVVTINANSTMSWEISPPELQRLEAEAVSNASLTIKFSYVITHPSNNPQNPPTIEEHREVALEAYEAGRRNPERDKLLQLLAGDASADTWISIKELFPKFVKVFNKGIARPAYQLMPNVVLDPTKVNAEPKQIEYRDVLLRLEREGTTMYWRVREDCEPGDHLLAIPKNNCNMLVMYTFNDKLFPETLNFISGGGIIGLYTTFVFLASRMLRGFFSGIYTQIMFDDLPNVDRVLQLCLDIYLVREAVELTLEEDLFAKLVFLYRSPETMIKWSRPKEDEEPRALPPSR